MLLTRLMGKKLLFCGSKAAGGSWRKDRAAAAAAVRLLAGFSRSSEPKVRQGKAGLRCPGWSRGAGVEKPAAFRLPPSSVCRVVFLLLNRKPNVEGRSFEEEEKVLMVKSLRAVSRALLRSRSSR